MPELTPTGAVDVVRRQVRRVRRRKNLYELQRTLYLMLAAGALAATAVLPLALFAPARPFAIAAWTAFAGLAGVVLFLVGGARRRWIARRAAVAWVETQAALGGRLRTLVELGTRPAPAPRFFEALLVAQIGRDLESWTPRRLVPRRVPRLALATVVGAVVVLVVVLELASRAVPAAPTIDGTGGGLPERSDEMATAARGERAVVAPGVPRQGERSSAVAQATNGGSGGDSPLASLANSLQENVRQQVWGKAWERVRDALAHAGTRSGGTRRAGTMDGGDELAAAESDEWEMARGPGGELTRRRRPADHDEEASEQDAEATDPAEPPPPTKTDESGSSEGTSGAGAGTAPDLFGGPPVETGAGSGSFELSLAARMRADGGAGRRGGSAAPDADPDARPELAADQRRESAAHRMVVPAAYETVVREVFAHRRTEQP